MTIKEFERDCGCVLGERLCAVGKELLDAQEALYRAYMDSDKKDVDMWNEYVDARESYVEHLRLPF